MLQNPCKTLGYKKNMVYEIPPGGGGGVNHIQPVAYSLIGTVCISHDSAAMAQGHGHTSNS